jgi:ketosteroid isomerase-like protein
VLSITETAARLYAGFDARDPEAILASLSPEFTGVVSAGMPLGVGGRHDGPDAMLVDCWARVFSVYDMTLEVERYLESGPTTVVAIGNYRGTERETSREMDARFAHVLEVSEAGITSLEQITDTNSW